MANTVQIQNNVNATIDDYSCRVPLSFQYSMTGSNMLRCTHSVDPSKYTTLNTTGSGFTPRFVVINYLTGTGSVSVGNALDGTKNFSCLDRGMSVPLPHSGSNLYYAKGMTQTCSIEIVSFQT